MAKQRCPACGSKQVTKDKGNSFFCHACRGTWNPNNMDEGGDYCDRHADERVIRAESADTGDRGIRTGGLRGGL